MAAENKLSAIVLAGGQSSRMGRDKALVAINGTPLLIQICQIAAQCAESVYVVTPWIDRYQPIFADAHWPAQFIAEVTPDESHPHGPLMGFMQGLTQIKSAWVLLLACDLPKLQVEVLQQWVTILPTVPETTLALLPRNPQGWWEPLCGFYRYQCCTSLETFVRQGGRSFQSWLETLSMQEAVKELPLFDPTMLLNCNTPADLQQFVSSNLSS